MDVVSRDAPRPLGPSMSSRVLRRRFAHVELRVVRHDVHVLKYVVEGTVEITCQEAWHGGGAVCSRLSQRPFAVQTYLWHKTIENEIWKSKFANCVADLRWTSNWDIKMGDCRTICETIYEDFTFSSRLSLAHVVNDRPPSSFSCT